MTNQVTKARGRPKGSFNKSTVEAATAAGLSPAEYVAAKAAEKAAQPKRQRGRPKKQVVVATESNSVEATA